MREILMSLTDTVASEQVQLDTEVPLQAVIS